MNVEATGAAMVSEMAEQPSVLQRIAARRDEVADSVRAVLPGALAGTVLVARGSSDHAATFGRYLLEPATGRPVALAAPSLHLLYGARTDLRGHLVVAVSQSGRTPEIVTVTRRFAQWGGRVIVVTNDPDSPLGEVARVVIELQAGVEHAVPATKTSTAQLAAFAILAQATGSVPWADHDWDSVPDGVRAVLDDPAPGRRGGRGLVSRSGPLLVARGLLYATALEGALKIRETTGLAAEGYSAADLRHGRIAAASESLPVLAVRAPGPAAADVDDVVTALRERGAVVSLWSPRSDADLPLPEGLPEAFHAFTATVRFQQVAWHAAAVAGDDPDRPSGLSKITLT